MWNQKNELNINQQAAFDHPSATPVCNAYDHVTWQQGTRQCACSWRSMPSPGSLLLWRGASPQGSSYLSLQTHRRCSHKHAKCEGRRVTMSTHKWNIPLRHKLLQSSTIRCIKVSQTSHITMIIWFKTEIIMINIDQKDELIVVTEAAHLRL